MALIYDSSHSGQEIDAAVDAVQTTIPSQLTQIGSKLDEIESDTVWNKAQTLSSAQKAQARANIGAVSNEEVAQQISVVNSKIDNIKPINLTNNGTITNLADEEDITSENNLLKLKDRHNYVILRSNKTFASQVTQANTIYEIRYDFDLGGASVTIPNNCVLEFDGGSLSNGSIVGNNLIVDSSASNTTNITFTNGCNFVGECVRASNIGMIPNNSNYAAHNSRIINILLSKHLNLIVDDLYYISGKHNIDYGFTCIGENFGELIWLPDSEDYVRNYAFQIIEGGSVFFNGLKMVGYNGSLWHVFIYSSIETPFVIDTINIENCDISGGNFLLVECNDLDFSVQEYGVNVFTARNNYIHDITTVHRSTASSPIYCFCLSDCPIIKKNIFENNRALRINGEVLNQGTTNEFLNTLKYIPEECPVECYCNTLDNTGYICDNTGYICLVLIEKKILLYKDNIVRNVISITEESAATYDIYGSVNELYYESNTCRNICNILTDKSIGHAAFAYSKRKVTDSYFSCRKIINSSFINRYDEIYNFIKNDIDYTNYDEFVGKVSAGAMGWAYPNTNPDTPFDLVEKINNYIDVGVSKLKNTGSDPTALRCSFIKNTITASELAGPLLFAYPSCIFIVQNNTFNLNVLEVIRPFSGSSLYYTGCKLIFTDNTILKNWLFISNNNYEQLVIKDNIELEGLNTYFSSHFNCTNAVFDHHFKLSGKAINITNVNGNGFGIGEYTITREVGSSDAPIRIYHHIGQDATQYYKFNVSIYPQGYQDTLYLILNATQSILFNRDRTVYKEFLPNDSNFSLFVRDGAVLVFNIGSVNYLDTSSAIFFNMHASSTSLFTFTTTIKQLTSNPSVSVKGDADFSGSIPTWYNGSKWIDANGYTAKSKKGTTDTRPTLTSSDSGFQYYDTTLGKYICWNGTAWVNMDGTSLSSTTA